MCQLSCFGSKLTRREEEDDTGREAALGYTQDRAYPGKGLVGPAPGETDCDCTPNKHDSWKIYRGTKPREEHVAGHLGQAVAFESKTSVTHRTFRSLQHTQHTDEEDQQRHRVLVGGHVQVFLHATRVCIADIAA
jgi:hypothetical protein